MYHPVMTRCGTVAVVGRPNVGKSTLINRLCGMHLSITSPRPQTTRVAIRAVVTRGGSQFVFIDNPGFSKERSLLDAIMRRAITESVLSADAVALVTEVTKGQAAAAKAGGARLALDPTDALLADDIARRGRTIDVVLINKIDRLRPRTAMLPLMALLDGRCRPSAIVPVSAARGEGLDAFLDVAQELLPEGPFQFDDDALTDRPQRFFVAELVRESVFELARLEVPYASAVTVDGWDEGASPVRIRASIHVEKEGQKAILIGERGAMIKKIGTLSRGKVEAFLERHVYLELTVDVRRDWRSDSGEADRMIGGGAP